MNSSIKKGLILAGVISASLIVPNVAFAIDVSNGVAMIEGEATDAVTEIGQALLGLAGVGLAFKWAKASIFG